MQNEMFISLDRYDQDTDTAVYIIEHDNSDIASFVKLSYNDDELMLAETIKHDSRLCVSAQRAAELVKECVIDELAAHADVCDNFQELAECVDAMIIDRSTL